MSPERWRQVKDICGALLDHAPDQRDAVLAQLCAGDDELKREVKVMLDQTSGEGSILSRPIWEEVNVPLALIGQQFSHYKIIEKIGSGGMGEVYRARDIRLKRDVAIKVLPVEFSRNPDRMARFQREAELLASLNHPNIAQIHGQEEANGSRCLVLEFIDGETLQERLERGPLSVEEALELARQMCDALEAAHERGIVHRDLKPANVKVTSTGQVKVLDFGLAKALVSGDPVGLSHSPTVTSGSIAGVILGTAAYMSPEQAKAGPADARSDVWAFGAVFYEMLTGKPPFPGETIVEVLGGVLKAEPDWTLLPETTPHQIRSLLRRCLQKDPRHRMRDIADARIEIEEVLRDPLPEVSSPVATTSRHKLLGFAALAAVAGLVAGLLMMRSPQDPPPPPLQRLSVMLPAANSIWFAWRPGLSLAVSPDGKQLAYVGRNPNAAPQLRREPLYIRSLADTAVRQLPGTEGARQPFFSPDSQWLAFFTPDGSLKKIPLAGGKPVNLAEKIEGGLWGFGAWIDPQTIIFSTPGTAGL
jgi:serine/threonine protein kinase